jgi:single-strand DNA-binding protein
MLQMSVIGNLGKDAEVKEVGGKKVIEFSVCHSYKKQDGTQISVWVNCSKWGETTAIAPYLKKGTKVYCQGQPSQDVWLKDGAAMGSLRLSVSKIELFGAAPATQPVVADNAMAQPVMPLPETGDLPF